MKIFQGILATDTSLLTACGGETAAAPDPDLDVGDQSPVDAREESIVGNALTPAQANTALALIDGICADTWCSGDYDFGFQDLICSRAAETCTLTLQLFPRGDEASAQQSYWRSCETSGFEGYGSLVDRATDGYESLNDDYYDALTVCTTRLVSRLP
ncbi:MAG TPA: hypothetical protein VFK05_22515 [Polyangiaceae bacterium]|nr:hypothetical protein [Polyangiaceae bacterium]